MKALSDSNRVKIIKMLQHRSMCVCELREVLQVSQPTVSKHLKILERAWPCWQSKGWSVGWLLPFRRQWESLRGLPSGEPSALAGKRRRHLPHGRSFTLYP